MRKSYRDYESLEDIPFVRALPEINRAQPSQSGVPRESYEKFRQFCAEIRIKTLTEKPEFAPWYIMFEDTLDHNGRARLYYQHTQRKSQLEKLDPRWLIATRSNRLYICFDWNGAQRPSTVIHKKQRKKRKK